MNIVIPHASFEVFGGAEKVVSALAQYLTNKKHTVSILTYSCPPDYLTMFQGCEITTGSYNKLKEKLHSEYKRYDIVNSHNHPMELLLWPKKKPHVWSYNEAPFYVQAGESVNAVEKSIVESSVSVAVVANEKNASMYKELYSTPVIHNMYGIDADFYSTNNSDINIREKLGLMSSDFVISVVGWIHPFKRQRDALKAFLEVKQNIPNAKLVLAGPKEPTETAFLENAARETGVSKDVIITGQIKPESIRALYYTSNVILCPFQKQGSYLTILESLCTRKPVIVSPDAMLSDDLSKNNVGIVTYDYIQAIMDIYTNKTIPNYDMWHKWASQFTVERYCQTMEKLFEGLLQA